ncbi:hypothetical protein CJF42_15395 [Pseudoalteromonas sp. NBT06-2]|uniref:UPF0149 family protein n=1 Tax=Pseudoalteromonas sp. NBT06-2 TaxID=2025950 RepID=UPI000BA78780|nr:UPF0149 family protein [Pseudoalteromonas sp. NBT06-2]PAJ73512.1 hypothetical protein CJF42_15395 [Pseudoalteromonas sp. NBT06-2]
MKELNLTSTELNLLADWLTGDETSKKTMNLPCVEGFLFALICAPAPVEDEVWLNEILAGDLSSLSDDKLFALMTLYNHLSTDIFETGYKLPKSLIVVDDVAANFIHGSALHSWSKGFARGIGYAGDLLDCENIDIELRSAFAMAISCLSYFSNESNAQQQAQEQNIHLEAMSQQMFEMMPDFATGFAEIVEAMAVSSGLFNDEGWD